MIHRYLAGRPEHGHAIFRARLGLAVMDLATCAAPDQAGAAYMRLVEEAIASGDGYVAREMLAHDRCRAVLSGTDKETLSTAVKATGFALGTIPDPLLADLMAAVDKSTTALGRALDPPA